MSHRIILALILVLAAGVPAAIADCPPETVDQLLGTWEWVLDSGGFAGGEYGPEDWGFTQQLEFTEGGTVIDYRDGVEVARSAFVFDCAGGMSLVAEPDVMPLSECGPYAVVFGNDGGVPTLELHVLICWDWYDFVFVARGPVAAVDATWSGIKSAYR